MVEDVSQKVEGKLFAYFTCKKTSGSFDKFAGKPWLPRETLVTECTTRRNVHSLEM